MLTVGQIAICTNAEVIEFWLPAPPLEQGKPYRVLGVKDDTVDVGLKDFQGNTWWLFANRFEPLDPEEIEDPLGFDTGHAKEIKASHYSLEFVN